MRVPRGAMLCLLVCVLVLSGCLMKAQRSAELAGKVDVFGVELYSPVDYRELEGVAAVEEPCLRGYERSFEALDVVVGYGFDKRVRRITTRNPHTSIFGVRPGMPLRDGIALVREAGLAEYLPPHTFKSADYSVKLLVDSADTVFGIAIEAFH